jgi:cellulose synthase/poly-beta-1,6-N-acetylglucosamine synthase-like glycosyltransferase
MVVALLDIWVAIVVSIMVIYAARHWYFTLNRMLMRQRPFYQDLYDGDLPALSVVVPMHNEGSVARAVLDALLASDYPHDRLEIIPIDDHSHDDTTDILIQYRERETIVAPVFVVAGDRGKPNAMNIALRVASHDIILVFDADYTPGRGLLRELAMGFVDPEVGAVMGRVVPRNTSTNLLTRLLSLERSGGYQVDQQARYNLDLMPQYGGTVGGFRRSLVSRLGGFDVDMLAEDTDLTLRLFLDGWKVVYANRAECYEEVPETWDARFTQLRRWSRGHNRALYNNLLAVLQSKHLRFAQKLDGVLLLFVYMIPPVLLSGLAANALLFFMGALPIWSPLALTFFVISYNAFGNFGPVYEIGAAELLDDSNERIHLLPYLFYLFLFNTWSVTSGVLDTIGDLVKGRSPFWVKTKRSAEIDIETSGGPNVPA